MAPPDRWDANRPWRKWYSTSAWRSARLTQLAKQPLCERCLAGRELTAATVVNHRTPHKGDWRLFIDPANHESTCKPHHDGEIQREERRGYVAGCDLDGRPLDPSHPWNQHRFLNSLENSETDGPTL